MKTRQKLRVYDIAGVAAAGLYALINISTIDPATWPHDDGSLFVFFFQTGFIAACVVLVLYYAVLNSLGCLINRRCILASFALVLAAEAFTFWVLIRASMDI
ncbi:MAG: hypothetical protein O2983_14645 [Planctomycetota bacterium]|nr:hypothetical protein [Planctomycetota bacterium]MDA0918240.1 hypothetical protein [Planctomycetota bacterium]MDA1160843.1 hypothetical protein [Planctomycetota bacterium]